MAIVIDEQGNLVDTENNINFFNRGEEPVFPKQGLEPLYPNFGATWLMILLYHLICRMTH